MENSIPESVEGMNNACVSVCVHYVPVHGTYVQMDLHVHVYAQCNRVIIPQHGGAYAAGSNTLVPNHICFALVTSVLVYNIICMCHV